MQLTDDLFGKQPALPGDADQHRRPGIADHFQQRQVVALLAAPGTEIGALLRQAVLEVEQVAHVVGEQAPAVDHEDAPTRLGLVQALQLHGGDDLFGDAATGGAGADEGHGLLAELLALGLASRQQGAHGHRGGALMSSLKQHSSSL